MDTQRAIITADEAAKILQVTTASIYLYVKQGKLKNASQITGLVRLFRDEVETFTPTPCGRRAGYRKANAKHPRLQLYYDKKRGNHDETENAG